MRDYKYHKLNGSYSNQNQYLVKKIEAAINNNRSREKFIPNVKPERPGDLKKILKAVLIKLQEYFNAKIHPEMYTSEKLDALLRPTTQQEKVIKYIQKEMNDPLANWDSIKQNLSTPANESLKNILDNLKPNWKMIGI